MSATLAADAAFVALAPVAAGAAFASVRQPSLARGARAALLAAAATGLRWAFAGAVGAAALQLALATTAAAVLVLEPTFFRGVDDDGTRRLRRAALPVLAWFALVLRVLLMTRWPSSSSGFSGWSTVPGAVPDLVFGATMLGLALLGAASRRTVGGVALAIPLAGSGAATMLVALSCTATPSAGVLAQLAVAAVASSWMLPAVALAVVRDASDGHGAAATLPPAFATEVSTVVAVMALALLVGTW